MRTFIESDDSISTGVSSDRKAMLMVRELLRFGMSVVGISATKRLGSTVYDVDGVLDSSFRSCCAWGR